MLQRFLDVFHFVGGAVGLLWRFPGFRLIPALGNLQPTHTLYAGDIFSTDFCSVLVLDIRDDVRVLNWAFGMVAALSSRLHDYLQFGSGLGPFWIRFILAKI